MSSRETTPSRVFLAPQFNTLEQQHSAASFGMWVFLATEVMLFGGLFTAYTVYRTVYAAGFAEGSRHLDLLFGGTNTAVLICSSITMALAVRAAKLGDRRKLLLFLAATAAIGALFMTIKAAEYLKDATDGVVPLVAWTYDGPYQQTVLVFMFLYFAMTGLHAFHLTVAIGIVLVTLFMAWRGAFPPAHFAPVEVVGLYWHFVDMIWIFLLPLLYLFGLQS
ncbi:MAG: cytochrome c oxidase subunit 3 [Chloroflexota bacterium]|nr:cytochrome c oxidase subunit 3 [Chloroflexota bacterium]